MRRIAVPVLLLSSALLAACGDGGAPTAGEASAQASGSAIPSAAPSGPTGDELVVELVPEQGAAVQTYTLSCAGEPSGDLPDPAAACDQLASQPDPFAELADDTVCTQQFGGPQTATVTGRWAGEPVDLELSRTDGCHIAQWDRLGALLPGPTG